MLTQHQADQLIATLKTAVRKGALSWEPDKATNEQLVSVELNGMLFILSMKRGPFEIRLNMRTADKNIGLCRIDGAPYHTNDDGTELRQPHIHMYEEGHGLKNAQAIDWYDPSKPYDTLVRFLDEVNARFPDGFQDALELAE